MVYWHAFKRLGLWVINTRLNNGGGGMLPNCKILQLGQQQFLFK